MTAHHWKYKLFADHKTPWSGLANSNLAPTISCLSHWPCSSWAKLICSFHQGLCPCCSLCLECYYTKYLSSPLSSLKNCTPPPLTPSSLSPWHVILYFFVNTSRLDIILYTLRILSSLPLEWNLQENQKLWLSYLTYHDYIQCLEQCPEYWELNSSINSTFGWWGLNVPFPYGYVLTQHVLCIWL